MVASFKAIEIKIKYFSACVFVVGSFWFKQKHLLVFTVSPYLNYFLMLQGP